MSNAYQEIIETLAELSNEIPEFEELLDYTPVMHSDFVETEFNSIFEDR